MPKVQVLVTVTAEGLVEVPQDVQDVEVYCRDQVGLASGGLDVPSVVQPPAISTACLPIPEPVEDVPEVEEVELGEQSMAAVPEIAPEPEPEHIEPVVAAVVSEP